MRTLSVKYNVGQPVYLETTVNTTKQHPCPDCLGTRKWRVGGCWMGKRTMDEERTEGAWPERNIKMILGDIVQRLAKAHKNNRDLDFTIRTRMALWKECTPTGCPFFTASIDDAITLIPGSWSLELFLEKSVVGWRMARATLTADAPARRVDSGQPCRSPALAICRAALAARSDELSMKRRSNE